ncbi:FmdE family protein [Thermosulfurimonas sp.]|uniref:FmdE family protein n=1 Tax=Thermosulfurimonas sp. TaxID=2080236 RepID=UPI0025DFD011|nr:FmdE family protein [Thermosulfurimonas sp.]
MFFTALETVVRRHGHLCPYLAIGWRAGLVFRSYVQEKNLRDFSVCAYNRGCAARALQLMGFPSFSEDMDEEVYTLLNARGENLLFLRTRRSFTRAPEKLRNLESKILRHTITLQEAEEYRYLFRNWVTEILVAPAHRLFLIS